MINSKNFTGSGPPKSRENTSVAYLKDKLYYLSGYNRERGQWTDQVDVRRSNESPWNNWFRF